MKLRKLISFGISFALCTLMGAQLLPRERMVDQLVVTAVNLFDSQKYQDAYDLLRQAEELDPQNDAVQYYLSNIMALAANEKEALRYMTRAWQLDSTNYWYGERLARMYIGTRQPQKAIALLEKLQESRPYDLNLMSDAMDSYLMVGEHDKADSLVAKIEIINGESDYTRLTRMEIMRQKGDFNSFFGSLKDYFKNGGLTASAKVDLLQKVLRSSDPRFNYAHLSDYDELLDICLEKHPTDTSVTHYAVGMLYSTDRKQQLLELCQKHGDDPYMVEAAMLVYSSQKNYKACMREADKLLSLSADDKARKVLAHNVKGDCYQHLGHAEKAYKEYELVLSLDPDNISVINNYAYFMACEGKNLGKCAKMSKKTIEAEPENATYLDTYAWILYKQKKYPLAKSYFKKAMLYGGKDMPEVLLHYAATLEALGENTLAKAYREQAAIKKDAKK